MPDKTAICGSSNTCMLLYLLRHAEAQSDPAIPDNERALTDQGILAIRKVAGLISKMGLRFDAVYSSPLLRARQTAELAVSPLPSGTHIRTTEHLLVGADIRKLFGVLNANAPDAQILLAGHEPYFSTLISTLLIGSPEAKVDVRKASLACIEVSHPVAPGGGLLKWLLPPRVFDLIP